MFIAHLPAGYVLAQVHPVLRGHTRWVMFGAILPDIDLAAFYLLHDGAFHHHSYLTHRPLLWISLTFLSLFLRRHLHGTRLFAIGLGGLLHMAQDTVAGAIVWGWPFSQTPYSWVHVPATQDWWVMSFLMHWTFTVEILICAGAALIWTRFQIFGRRPAKRKSPGTSARA